MDKEDLNILNFFKDKKDGFYVDVGCFHPLDRNNTYLLYLKNWRGINIDISQFSIDLFNFLRPDDFNLKCAVSEKNKIIRTYFQKELSQLSTTDELQAKKVFQGKIKTQEVQSYSLDHIIENSKFCNKEIDLLDIDVEGSDYQVLLGLNFEKYKPKLICIEIHNENLENDIVYKFLSNKGYKHIWSGVFSHLFKLL
ncbi:FkbM family methyltransferase [Candidatus Pelagibacter sp.]|jgi:FkbM family methyltransferase|nr:FkbM family methyltransferase [Candidatus Pelagibacter sp.]